MKVGDLVRGEMWEGWVGPSRSMTGIIVRESPRSNSWGDEDHRWWVVLCEDGKLIEEVENYMELVK